MSLPRSWSLPARIVASLCALTIAVLSAPALAATTFGADPGDPFASPAAAKLMNAAAADAALPDGFEETTVWSGLAAPTVVRFAPDGRVFVALKSGIIDVFDGVDDPTPAIYADLRPQVADFWDRGLLGLAVDPRFDEGRPYLYALYTYNKDPNSATVPRWPDDSCPTPPGANGDGCVVTGRLSRISPDGSEKVLIEDWCQQYPTHSVGTIQFGPDGALYVGSGDGASYTFADYGQDGAPVNPCGDPPGTAGSALTPPTAQGGALRSQAFRREPGRPVTLDGSILRVDPDTGDALSDNPNAADPNANRRRIVAYGFRNPYRFVFRPGTSEIWAGDVGWDTWEEIDRIEDPLAGPTENFGWPCYEGDAVMGAYRSLGVNVCERLYQQGESAVVDPYFVYQHGAGIVEDDGCGIYSSSITGITFYSGGNFPAAYQDALFFTDYARGCIWWMPAGDDGLPDASDVRLFQRGTAGPVYLTQGPDGAVWYVDIEGGTIRRIAYPGGNGSPNALATADRTSGPLPLEVAFDGSESSDPDGGGLAYSWDLDGDGTFGDSTEIAPRYTYTAAGRHNVKLRVTDAGGLTDTASLAVTAGSPPRLQLASPVPELDWATGDEIGFSGSAVDAAGEPIPDERLSWQLNIRHCSRFQEGSCHTHVAQNSAGGTGTFIAPDHDWPSHLELVFTAVDANGLSASESVDIYPRTVDLTFTSAPRGAQLSYGSYSITTPSTMTFIEGSQSTLTAGSPQSIDGHEVDFASWDDGGPRTRSVAATEDTTYHASFVPSTSTTLGGHATVGTNTSSAPPGGAEAYRFTAVKSGGGSKLRLFVDEQSAATELTLGLYTDAFGEPGRLLGSGTTATVTPGEWNEVSLPASVQLTAGQAYWFGLLNPITSGGTLRWRDRAVEGGGEERTSLDRQLSGFQILWTSLGAWNDGPVSGYVLGATQSPEPAELAVAPAALSFSATEGATTPQRKSLHVSNAGAGTLEFTASADRPWLSVTPAAGTAPRDVEVSVDTSGLAAGTYSGHVTVDAGLAEGSPESVPVTVTVAEAAIPVLAVTPTTLSFNAVAGGEDPEPRSIEIANTGQGDLHFTVSDDAGWLTVAPSGGSAPATLAVAVDLDGLAPGTHEAAVTIRADGISGSPATIPVRLIVSTAPAPGTDTLGGATIIGTSASSAPPGAGEAYRIAGAATGTASRLRLYVDGTNAATKLELGLYADLGGEPAALLASGAVSTVVAGAWNEVTLTPPVTVTEGTPYWFALLNPAGSAGPLVWRDHAGEGDGAERTSWGRTLSALPASWLTLGAWDDGPVSGHVIGTAGDVDPPAAAELALSPSSLELTAVEGATRETVRVSTDGGGPPDFVAGSDAEWLTVTPDRGAAPQDLTVAADPARLAPGTYTGRVTVRGTGSTATLTVRLTVRAPPMPDPEPSPAPIPFPDPAPSPPPTEPAPSPDAGLVGAWGFDETAGTTAADSSGKGNAGTISGATRVTAGRRGGALAFNGEDNWVTVPGSASLRLGEALTLEGWAYPTAGGSSWRAMMVKETTTGLAWALYPAGDRGVPGGHVASTSEHWASAAAKPRLNAWTHYAVTYDGAQIRLYVNGVLAGSRAQSGPVAAGSRPLRFGGTAMWPEWFEGRLDELRVYDRALSAEEIRVDMLRPVSSTAVLQAHAKANKQAGKAVRSKRAKPVGKAVRIKRYRSKRPHGTVKNGQSRRPGGRR